MIVTFPHLCLPQGAQTGKRGPEIRAGPIPLRPGKNVTTASRSMEFHHRILGRQFASCIRISRIPSPCIGAPCPNRRGR